MRANNDQANLNNDRQKEYQRQQERLKAMATAKDKTQPVSTDMMIENLLKDSFSKVPQTQVKQIEHSCVELPYWLNCNGSAVPAQYKYLWSLVQSAGDLADTNKVSQLLLTSGLHVDALGFIWSLANKAIPGQLTKQEFYIVLALVSLVQTGYTFNNLSILKLLTVPSLPILQIDSVKYSVPQPDSLIGTNNSHMEFSNSSTFQPFSNEVTKTNDENLSFQVKNSFVNAPESTEQNFPCIGSSPTAELEDDFSAFQSVSVKKDEIGKNTNPYDSSDDFTEFQSANVDPFETVVINQKREIPKISLPKTLTGKFTNLKSNLLKISPEAEKKLKVLSGSETLSSLPESKISSSNKVSTSTSISVLGSNHGIGSRLANHSFSTKSDKTKGHKRHKIKINSTAVDSSADGNIILGVKTKNLEVLMPKCSAKTFVLKETKIKNEDVKEETESELCMTETTRKIEIPMLGTFNETVLPTQSKTSTVDLITVQEDKYSALRDIGFELTSEEPKEVNDEFGDFLSADISTVKNEATEEKEDWGDWNFNTKTSSLPVMPPQTTNLLDEGPETKNDLIEPFSLLTVDESKKPSPNSQDYFSLNDENNDENNEKQKDLPIQPIKNQSETEFWDFFSSETKSQAENIISRHGSLPSLDLKISLTDETELETIWKKCINSCLSLIQEGYEIFNNISTKSVLDEVFAAPETEKYLKNLHVVVQISKRITQNFSSIPSTQDELEKLWGRLHSLCFEYNIPLKSDEDNLSEGKLRCSICLGPIGTDIVNEGACSYHPSCANLWINCVETVLPTST